MLKGMVYIITKLINGDCLEVMPTLPDKSIDMILCDLPYGTTACKWDVVIPFEPLWKEYKRLIKDNGAIVLFGSEPFSSLLVCSNLDWFKYEWIWNKQTGSNFASVKYQPFKEHENISVFYESRPTYNPQKIKRSDYSLKCHPIGSKHLVPSTNKPAETSGLIGKAHYMSFDGMRMPKSIIEIKQPKGRGFKSLHPTQKPVALMEYLIKTYTNEGDTVLDNCMGSGSTGVACENAKRTFIGIEKDEKYFSIAEKRIAEAQQQLRLTV
jgi:DNA modification methylase